ncbi:MAG: UpxY family transcription antiterminator [Lentimicrobiaceae bacterium]|nr:UpxY family transcription antiterminator [Lentimicrobiaceae bacterium]
MSISSKQWLALYTRSRWEKKVFKLLTEGGHEAFLPLRREKRQWKDRKKWVEEPLIRSYIFVNTGKKEYYDILNTPGAVCYIFFEGKPAPIREEQILFLKSINENPLSEFEVTSNNFQKGDLLTITSGAFSGFEGELIEYRGRKKVLIRLEQLGKAILITIPIQYISILNK